MTYTPDKSKVTVSNSPIFQVFTFGPNFIPYAGLWDRFEIDMCEEFNDRLYMVMDNGCAVAICYQSTLGM